MDLNIFWDINTAAVGYRVSYKLHSSSVWSTPVYTTDNYMTITGLAVCQAYDFKIEAQCQTDNYSIPTITLDVVTNDGKCWPNNYFELILTNVSSQDPVSIVQIDNDMGASTTATMPVLVGSSTTQTLYMMAWGSTNFFVRVNYLGGYSMFKIEAYRNGILEYTSPYYAGGVGSTYWYVPIVLLHPPASTDTIEFKLNYP